jgi:hypothetical protein
LRGRHVLHARHGLAVLEALAQQEPAGPQLVFAHILLPHGPFVFDPDGSVVSEAESISRSYAEKMDGQLGWTNARLLEIVDKVLARDRPTIIAIVSDEGPLLERPVNGDFWDDMTPDDHRLKQANLLSVHSPNGWEVGVYDTMTNVNLYRAIVNTALGTNLSQLEDRAMTYRDHERDGPMMDVTELLRRNSAVPTPPTP